MDVDEHIAVFNAAVVDGDWSAFIERFDDDAIVEFVGPPFGPFVGRSAIAEAYASSPPDDIIEAQGPVVLQGDEHVVRYRWATTTATGTMRFTESAGLLSRLVITFD